VPAARKVHVARKKATAKAIRKTLKIGPRARKAAKKSVAKAKK
jgi:hypothetical protein